MNSKSALSAACLAAFTYSLSGTPVGGPFYYNNSVYYLTTKGQSWSASEAEAVAMGGHLATVNDQGEEDFIRQTIVASVNNEVWLGLNNLQDANTWEWTSGQPVTYLNWNPGEPNFISSDHAVQSGPGWNNTFDSEIFFYGLVEKSVPDTSASLPLLSVSLGAVLLAKRRVHK